MQRRNIRRLVFGIALTIIATGGLYITLQQSRGGDLLTEDQKLRNPDEMPKIPAPGNGLSSRENLVATKDPEPDDSD